MTVSSELLAQHFEYSLWATQKILAEVHKLSHAQLGENRGNSFGGILDTLIHIFRADRVWFRRCTGEPTAPFAPEGEVLDLATIEAAWPDIMNGFAAWIRSQPDDYWDGQLAWRNIKGQDMEGVRHRIMLHIVNHGTYHRGQVITMIKQAGGEVVSTDLLYYPGK